MCQCRIRLHPTATTYTRIFFTLDAIHLTQSLLKLRCTTTSRRFGPASTCPLRPFDHAIVLWPSRRIPYHLDAESDQPQRQFRWKIARRTPRKAIVYTKTLRHPPLHEALTQLFLNLSGRYLVPLPVGGKPQSKGPRQYTHRRHVTSSQTPGKPTGLFPLHPSARSRAELLPDAPNVQGVSQSALGPNPHVETNVAKYVRWEATSKRHLVARSPESVQHPTRDVLDGDARRSETGLRPPWVPALSHDGTKHLPHCRLDLESYAPSVGRFVAPDGWLRQFLRQAALCANGKESL